MGFKPDVVQASTGFLGAVQGSGQVQSRAHANFQYAHRLARFPTVQQAFFQARLLQKHIAGFAPGTLHRMVVGTEFGVVECVAAVFGGGQLELVGVQHDFYRTKKPAPMVFGAGCS